MPRQYLKRGSKALANRAYAESAKGRACVRRYSRKKYYRIKEFLNRMKTRPCFDCDVQYSPWIMQFDHRNPYEKRFTISATATSWELLKKEVDKCDVVCANCHAERTHKFKHWNVRRACPVEEYPTQGVFAW